MSLGKRWDDRLAPIEAAKKTIHGVCREINDVDYIDRLTMADLDSWQRRLFDALTAIEESQDAESFQRAA